MSINGLSGKLICPGYDRVCTGSVWCNDPLTCIEKESIFYDDTSVGEFKIKMELNDNNRFWKFKFC